VVAAWLRARRRAAPAFIGSRHLFLETACGMQVE